jgi:hypothetical protein
MTVETHASRIRSCKWSEPFAQADFTTNYRCHHKSAKKEIDASNG